MTNWNELANQQRRLSEERARADAFKRTPQPQRPIDKESPQYLRDVFKRFEQIGVRKMLEDVSRTTAVWGNLGRVIEIPPQFGNLRDGNKYPPRGGEKAVYECSSIKLKADYKHYKLAEEDIIEMRKGEYTSTFGSSGLSSMGEPWTKTESLRLKGPHMEVVGKKEVLASEDKFVALNVETYYLPQQEGHIIVVTEWFPPESHTTTSLATEMGNNPINSVFRGTGYEIVRGDKGCTTSSISYGLDHFAQNCVIFRSDAIALTFYAENFDKNLITQFLKTAFATSIFLRQTSGQTIPAIKRAEEAGRLKIEERVRHAPTRYFS